MIAGTADDPVVDYRLERSAQKGAYLTAAGRLYVLDRATGEHTLITAGMQLPDESDPWYGWFNPDQYFALTSEGRYLVYLSAEPGSVRAVDLQAPDLVYDLGACQAHEWGAYEVDCLGPVLSEDGQQVAFQDGRGIWISEIAGGELRLLLEHDVVRNPDGNCCVYLPLSWSLNGQWLLVRVGAYEGYTLAVVEVRSGQIQELPHTWVYIGIDSEAVWGDRGLWVSNVQPRNRAAWLYQAQVSAEGAPEWTYVISETESSRIFPSSLKALPRGRLAFAQERCTYSAGADPAVYIVETDGTIHAMAPLPDRKCSLDPLEFGSVSWTADASAFLYLSPEPHRAVRFNPVLLGLTDGSALWDVRERLRGATLFRWSSAGR